MDEDCFKFNDDFDLDKCLEDWDLWNDISDIAME